MNTFSFDPPLLRRQNLKRHECYYFSIWNYPTENISTVIFWRILQWKVKKPSKHISIFPINFIKASFWLEYIHNLRGMCQHIHKILLSFLNFFRLLKQKKSHHVQWNITNISGLVKRSTWFQRLINKFFHWNTIHRIPWLNMSDCLESFVSNRLSPSNN